LDVTLLVDSLRSGHERLLSTREPACLNVGYSNCDRKGGIGFDDSAIGRVLEFGRGDVSGGCYNAQWSGIAGAAGNLLPIGQGKVDCGAEVDVVVGRSQRRLLARLSWALSIVCKP
jgi:hypothetical protein